MFFKNSKINKLQVYYTKKIISEKYRKNIGEYTYGNPKIMDWNEGTTLKIGKFCSIANSVTILLGGEHRIDWVTTYPFPASQMNKEWKEAKNIKGCLNRKGDVIIENDVWIGHGVTILSGVTIGNGAVIGACSLVSKNIKPYSIVAGNPIKVIRKRFDNVTIKKLLRLQWWEWPIDKIKKNLDLLCSPNINEFINLI